MENGYKYEGLKNEEVIKSREKFGMNVIKEKKKVTRVCHLLNKNSPPSIVNTCFFI